MIKKIKKIKRKKVLKNLYMEYQELSNRNIDFKEFCEEFNKPTDDIDISIGNFVKCNLSEKESLLLVNS